MKFRLKSMHHIDDLLLEEGTEIEAAVVEVTGPPHKRVRTVEKMGRIIFARPMAIVGAPTGRGVAQPSTTFARETETTWAGPPSIEMEPLDAEAEAACEKRLATYMSINDLPIVPVQAPAKV